MDIIVFHSLRSIPLSKELDILFSLKFRIKPPGSAASSRLLYFQTTGSGFDFRNQVERRSLSSDPVLNFNFPYFELCNVRSLKKGRRVRIQT